LKKLYATEPIAQKIGEKARAILVFPNIVKAGFVIGGQYGEGALVKNGQIVGYDNTVAASYGLQAGAQTFGYALFLMNDQALAYLDQSDGWEIGVGPSIVIVDKGMAQSLTTTTLQDDVYAFIFDQKGLMAALGIQGSKITKTSP
jgi:lipid-binding SYLF domain-containing protein